MTERRDSEAVYLLASHWRSCARKTIESILLFYRSLRHRHVSPGFVGLIIIKQPAAVELPALRFRVIHWSNMLSD